MNTWVAAALDFVPKGDECQSNFRMQLNARFRNQLGPHPENPNATVSDVVQAAMDHAPCVPKFDPALLALSWPD